MKKAGTAVGDGELDALVSAVTTGANHELSRAVSLPPQAYASDDFYELEVRRIFCKSWICVGHVSQVPLVGDYFTVDLVDELLVIVRSAEGIKALSRVCLHRWTPLVNGTGRLRRFTCPFHKWSYDLDGELLITPLMDGVDFDPAGCRLPSFRVEMEAGFIFVALEQATHALAPQLADFRDHVARYHLDEAVVAGTLEINCKINWKIVVETFMEAYHHIGTHLTSFEPYFPANGSYIEDGRPAWTCGHIPAKADVPDEALTSGFPEFADLTTLSPQERREYHFYLVYPFHVFIIMRDRTIWFRLQPKGPALTHIQSYLLLRPEAREAPGFAERLAEEMRMAEIIATEDTDINEDQQRGATSASAAPGRFSHLEKASWQLANYIRSMIKPSSA